MVTQLLHTQISNLYALLEIYRTSFGFACQLLEMCSLQLSNCRAFEHSEFRRELRRSSAAVIRSSFWGGPLDLSDAEARGSRTRRLLARRTSRIFAEIKMNPNEYMVTLEKPLGIRFALSVDGKVFVLALQKGGNAEKLGLIMVGDTLKKAGQSSDGKLVEIKDFSDTETLRKEKSGAYSLVLERPFAPFPTHQLFPMDDIDIMFNRGRVPIATWNKSIGASNLQESSESSGNSGFAVFCPKFLSSKGWKCLNDQNRNGLPQVSRNGAALPCSPLIAIFTDVVSENAEWGHGNFPLEEYANALERSKEELYYNHSLGMHYSKITEQIYVGSCIQTKEDVQTLSTTVGVTAVLNFQSMAEAANWGLDSNSINESCQNSNILMVNYPIRDADSFDMRKKLPFCVGVLLRLLKKNHRVYVTCTTGFDRSPACVIAYLHWMTDTSLHAAYDFVTGLHSCKPDRPAIAWATWDLIAMVENGTHEGPATHAVTFVWNGHEGEEVHLVGDFTGNWKEPIKAVHKGGPRHEVEIRLPQGKYYYKFITNGDWRHSTSSPTERDQSGNLNNVIVVGDTASVKPTIQSQEKDANIMKVIERPLTENERFMLAKAARCVAFGVCPIRLAPK
ncbi:phosphoglucan phosphatase LSF1, chloroplastic-like [Salvia miltiorrhiza]|uniref:phosphoglucan phosphatase LSF1, chloroplastic-like n=1 Tax=Salvia miltiorrhiza TaxID=226208 RepID=UPI0025ABB47B|nr:phosphoglucan phosphatase LSF1, chloroplastic-like [Salvia miltiorrhiza]